MATVSFSEISGRIHDFREFRRFLQIQDHLTHRMVPLDPSPIQQKVRDAIITAEREERPARLIILKARREGVSTILQASFAHRVFTRGGVKAYTIAHNHEAASNLHGMSEQMWANLPKRLQVEKASYIRGRRLSLRNGSEMRTATAEDADAGRSGAATLVHISELASWPRAEETLTAVLQIVPNAVGTIVAMESTAKGMGGAFFDEWMRATAGESAYLPMFFSWMDDPTYVDLNVTSLAQLGDLSDNELELVAEHKATPGQVAWWRARLRGEARGNIDVMKQEFPTVPEDAFLATGRQFFEARLISRFKPAEPIGRFKLVLTLGRGRKPKKGEQVAERDDKDGPLWIYEFPQEGVRYVLFCDPAGVVGEIEAKHFRSGEDPSDYTAMVVVNCQTQKVAAVWHDRIDGGLIGIEAAKVGILYNKAVVCVEATGGYGSSALERLRDIGYSPIHRDRMRNRYDRTRVPVYGWVTNSMTRPLMLDTLKDVLRDDPNLLMHAQLKAEMQTFVIGKNHIPSAQPGRHDDIVMATAGAYTILPEYQQRMIALPARMGEKRRKGAKYEDVLSRATKRKV